MFTKYGTQIYKSGQRFEYMQFELCIEYFKPGVAIDCHCMEDDDSNNEHSHALVSGAEPFPSLGQTKGPGHSPLQNALLKRMSIMKY